MIKFFKNGDKEHLKIVLDSVYHCQNVEQMSDDELVFCYIAKKLESSDKFHEMFESNELDLCHRVEKLEKKTEKLEKRLKRLKNDI